MRRALRKLANRARWTGLGLITLLASGCDSVAEQVLQTIGMGLSIADVWV